MSYTYEQKESPRVKTETTAKPTEAPGQGVSLLMTRAGGSGAPRNGPSFDLDAAMKTRMENTFGDLSAVRHLGNRAEGADKAGSMVPAPAGETAYTGPVTHTLSDSSPSPASAGAMQAKRGWSFKKPKPDPKPKSKPIPKLKPMPKPEGSLIPPEPDPYGPDTGLIKTDDASIEAAQKSQSGFDILAAQNSRSDSDSPAAQDSKRKADPYETFFFEHMDSNKNPPPREGMEDLTGRLMKKYTGPGYKKNAIFQNISRPKSSDEKEDVQIDVDPSRMLPGLVSDRGRGFNMSEEAIEALVDKIMAPHKEGMSEAEKEAANKQFDEGVEEYKGILTDDLNHMEKTYGAMLTQMHPQDVIPQLSKNYHQEYHFMTDAVQLAKSSKYMNDSKKEDRRFRKLSNYYADADNQLTSYAPYATSNALIKMTGDIHKESIAPVDKELEASLKGPKMNEKQLKAYKSRMKKRAKKGGWRDLLFGRYR